MLDRSSLRQSQVVPFGRKSRRSCRFASLAVARSACSADHAFAQRWTRAFTDLNLRVMNASIWPRSGHLEPFPAAWTFHEMVGISFGDAVSVNAAVAGDSGRNGPVPNPAGFSFGARGAMLTVSLSIRCSLVRTGLPANRNEQPIAARSVFEGEEE